MAKKKNRKNKGSGEDVSVEATTPSAAPPALDAAAHDRFATSFRPSWLPPEGDAAPEVEATSRSREHTLSGETSLDAIPLPPLPTEKPRKQLLAVALVLLLIVGAGVVASMRSEPRTPAASPENAEPSAR